MRIYYILRSVLMFFYIYISVSTVSKSIFLIGLSYILQIYIVNVIINSFKHYIVNLLLEFPTIVSIIFVDYTSIVISIIHATNTIDISTDYNHLIFSFIRMYKT